MYDKNGLKLYYCTFFYTNLLLFNPPNCELNQTKKKKSTK